MYFCFIVLCVFPSILYVLPSLIFLLMYITVGRSGAVVKVLSYKPAGRGFDSRCVIEIFQ